MEVFEQHLAQVQNFQGNNMVKGEEGGGRFVEGWVFITKGNIVDGVKKMDP